MNDHDSHEWIGTREASDRCGCSIHAMRDRVRRKTVIFERRGGRWKIRSDSLDRKPPGRPKNLEPDTPKRPRGRPRNPTTTTIEKKAKS